MPGWFVPTVTENVLEREIGDDRLWRGESVLTEVLALLGLATVPVQPVNW